jgi:hypothetical protein
VIPAARDRLLRHLGELRDHVDADRAPEVVAGARLHQHGTHAAADVDEDVAVGDLSLAQDARQHAPR